MKHGSKSRPLSKKASLGRRQHQGRFFLALVLFGVLLFAGVTYRKQVYYRALTPAIEVMAVEGNADYWPVRLHVGGMVNVALEAGNIHDGRWYVSDDAGVYLVDSGVPKMGGNIIVYGHNTPQILGNIRAFTGNEIISLELSNGETRRYQIASMTEVDADDVALLRPTEGEFLTIYTCSGFLDSKRWVVRARPEIEKS